MLPVSQRPRVRKINKRTFTQFIEILDNVEITTRGVAKGFHKNDVIPILFPDGITPCAQKGPQEIHG